MIRHIRIAAALASVSAISLGVGAAPAYAQAAQERRSYNIDAQALGDALSAYAEQSGIEIIFAPDAVRGRRSVALRGSYAPAEALALLLRGTGLSSRQGAGATIIVEFQRPGGEGSSEATRNGYAVLDGEVGSEIVVTGSNIRGVVPAGQKLIVVGREDIGRSGYSTVTQIFDNLPQAFRGNDRGTDSLVSGHNLGRSTGNLAGSAALNLRGFGVDSTLTLINGRRIAPGGLNGVLSDISGIPVGAIERIEVLPDGASALYGSDALAGVVNIVLRKDYDGLDTSLRYGEVAHSPRREIQLSQALGHDWSTGSALLAFDFLDTTALPAASRRRLDGDHTQLGGRDRRQNACNPGTLEAGGTYYALPPNQDGTELSPADLVPNTANICDYYGPQLLLSEGRSWSGMTRLNQEVAEGISVFADGIYFERRSDDRIANRVPLSVPASNPFYINPAGGSDPVEVAYDLTPLIGPRDARQSARGFNIALGIDAELGSGWSAVAYTAPTKLREAQWHEMAPDPLVLAAALADSEQTSALNPFGDGSAVSPGTLARIKNSQVFAGHNISKLWLNHARLSGPLFRLPGGEVKLAAGVEHRDWVMKGRFNFVYRERDFTSPYNADLNRDVLAGFGELHVPLIGDSNRSAGLEKLSLSLAGRYERYSDFGTNFSPRIGIEYSPAAGMRLRGSWGRSFKAPSAEDLNTSRNIVFIFDIPDPQSSMASSPAIFLQGGNPDLKPEVGRNWSLGVDLDRSMLGGFSLSVTYYQIDVHGRLETPPLYSLAPENGPTVIRNPSDAEIAAACAAAPFGGNYSSAPGSCATAPVAAIFDYRVSNLARLKQKGLDFQVGYGSQTPFGEVGASVNATYILRHDAQATRDVAIVNLVNTTSAPLRFRVRGAANWARDGWSVFGAVNYANSYRDSYSPVHNRVGSWTTVDANIAYDLGSIGMRSLRNTKVALNVRNLFHTLAPFMDGTVNGDGYDAANSDLVGRTISVVLKKSW